MHSQISHLGKKGAAVEREVDAVLVGSGVNALAAALHLA